MILVADIGGTKVDLALSDPASSMLSQREQYLTKNYSSFHDILTDYFEKMESSKRNTIHAMHLGVAGPVANQVAHLTNLGWTIDSAKLKTKWSLEKVIVLNDMEAHAYGALNSEHLDDQSDRININIGQPQQGHKAILAAGTGLGEAFMIWNGSVHTAYACEGGHTSFAPQSPLESELLLFAQREHHHVSAERLISGALGFPILRDFFHATGRLHDYKFSDIESFLQSQDPGEMISEGARRHDPACLRMMDLFVSMYASEAGNLALKINALGGIYICGGIARKNINFLRSDLFIQAFSNKGRYRSLLKNVPIWVLTDPDNGLKGLVGLPQ